MGQAFPRGEWMKAPAGLRLADSCSDFKTHSTSRLQPQASLPLPALPALMGPSKTAFTNLMICLHAVLSLGQGPSSPLCTQSTEHIVGALKTIQ